MPNKRTSQEVDGTTFTNVDEVRIARSGNNYKLDANQIFSETITLADLDILASNNGLIAGRYYKVVWPDNMGNTAVNMVQATSNNKYSRIFTSNKGNGYENLNVIDSNGLYNYMVDSQGNVVIFPAGLVVDPDTGVYFQFPTNNQLHMGNTYYAYVDNGDYSAFRNLDYFEIYENLFQSSEFSFNNYIGDFILYQNKFENSVLTFNKSNSNIQKSRFKNCNISFQGTSSYTISNSSFQDCNVVFRNGNTITELHIKGIRDKDGNVPTYYIDGADRTKVLNNWAGDIVGDIKEGYSTVKAILVEDNDNQENPIPLTYSTADESITFVQQGVIGIYYINEPQVATNIYNLHGYNQNHPIRVETINKGSSGNITFQFQSNSGTIQPFEALEYHGITPKVGQLWGSGDYIKLVYNQNDTARPDCWMVVDGKHYDV